MKRGIVLFALLFYFSFTFAFANITPPAPAKPLAEATVAVNDESATSLQLGLQAAFSEVMMKMSGNPKIMEIPAVQNISTNLTEVIQSYSYVQQASVLPPSKPSLLLDVVFDQNALQQLLQTVTSTAQDNATIPPIASEIKLLVTGIKNMNDYSLLMQALHEIPAISSTAVISVDPDRVAIDVHLNSDITALKTALSSNNHFKALMTTNATTTTNETELFYLWTGTSS